MHEKGKSNQDCTAINKNHFGGGKKAGFLKIKQRQASQVRKFSESKSNTESTTKKVLGATRRLKINVFLRAVAGTKVQE